MNKSRRFRIYAIGLLAVFAQLGLAQSWAAGTLVAGKYQSVATMDSYPTHIALGQTLSLYPRVVSEPIHLMQSTPLSGTVTFLTESGAPLPGCVDLPISAPTGYSCPVTGQALGIHRYKAKYSNDPQYSDSESALVSVTTTGPNVPTLAAGGNPSHGKLNQPFKLTATLSSTAGTPTGTVTFEYPYMVWTGLPFYTPLEGCANVPLVNGFAECPTLRNAAGRHLFRITYWGDEVHRVAQKELYFPVGTTPQRTDFNNDGRSDVLLHHAGNFGLVTLLSDGDAFYAATLVGTQPSADWQVAGVTNLHSYSGAADIIWRNRVTGEVRAQANLYGTVTETSELLYTEPNLAWKIEQFADLDDDGSTEFIWRNDATGEVYAMRVNGLTVQGGQMIYIEPNLNWKIVSSGDMNGDGKGDLLWRNAATGDVFAMLMDGFNVTGGGVIYSEPNPDWKIVGLADFNGDGNADVLWQNTATGDVFQMQMNGTAILAGQVIYNEPNTQWNIVGLGDYDADGKADILWRNDATGIVYMMLMDGFTIRSSDWVYFEPDLAWRIVGP
jgi:hypothetical protein